MESERHQALCLSPAARRSTCSRFSYLNHVPKPGARQDFQDTGQRSVAMLSIPVANVAGQADGFVPDDLVALLAENVLRNSALRSQRLAGCLEIS